MTGTRRRLRPHVSKIQHIDRKRRTGVLYVFSFYIVLLLCNRVGGVCDNGSDDKKPCKSRVVSCVVVFQCGLNLDDPGG